MAVQQKSYLKIITQQPKWRKAVMTLPFLSITWEPLFTVCEQRKSTKSKNVAAIFTTPYSKRTSYDQKA